MKPSLEQVARKLVRSHRSVEPKLQRAIFYPDPAGKEVRLVEVVSNSPRAGQAYPFRFAPEPERGVPFPMVLIELSPAEFRDYKGGRLPLPAGWEDESANELYRRPGKRQ